MAEKSEKLRQKELKAPDAFQEAGLEASSWIMERSKLLLMVLAAVVAAGVIASIATYLSRRGESTASQAFADSLALLGRPVQGQGTLETAPTDPNEKPFATQQEKEQAIQKALTEVRQQHSGSDAAVSAALPLAQAEYRLGNHDAALSLYDEFLARTPAKDPLRLLAMEGRGYTLEAKGDLDGALTAFGALSKESSGPMLAGMGDYHRARLLMAQNKLDEAAQVLVALPVNHAGTAAARMATERISELTARGVKMPAAPAARPDAG